VVGLAGEQAMLRRNTAESLASLARRNQNLLYRQLGFITQLERDEADATALANLFELDHLATRMRRNAESLLVLIGERSPRRWSEPVAVDEDGSLVNLYGVGVCPVTVFARDGRVRESNVGNLTEAELRTKTERLTG